MNLSLERSEFDGESQGGEADLFDDGDGPTLFQNVFPQLQVEPVLALDVTKFNQFNQLKFNINLVIKEVEEDVLEVERRVDVKAEAEVDVEGGVRKLFVVVGRQGVDLLVLAREKELAVLYRRQTEEHHIADVDA